MGIFSWCVVQSLWGHVAASGSWEAGGNGGNCGTGVRARISEPTPFIYLAFEKMDPFIYLIVQNVDLFIYCPLIFYTHLLLVVDRYRSQFIEYQENQQPQKNYERKKYTHIPGCQKSGAFHIRIEKNGVSHILFVEKKGANHIPGSAEKGGHSARPSLLCHI